MLVKFALFLPHDEGIEQNEIAEKDQRRRPGMGGDGGADG